MNTFAYSIKNSLKNLWRNRYNAVATILLLAIMLFILNIILVVNIIVKSQLNELGQKISMIVYLQDDIAQEKAQEITDSLTTQPGVKNADYISKDEALQLFLKTHPKTASYYEKFNLENTLPPSIQITVQSPDDYEKIQNFLMNSSSRNFINTYGENMAEGSSSDPTITEKVTQNLLKLDKFSRTLLFWIVAAFLIGSILIMNNDIHLTIYHRRGEINIMRLVGATPNFIRLPFLLEAAWASIAATLISFLGFFLVAKITLLPEINFFASSIAIPFTWILIGETIILLLLTTLSSFAAIEKHLRRHMILS